MAFKLVVFSCLVALVRSSVVPAAVAAAPVVTYAGPPVAARIENFDPTAQYRFGYNVEDSLTGDIKSQSEQSDGGVVQGQYSFVEADGTRRIVEYTADPVNGFNALVRNEPVGPVLSEAPIVAARIAAAPVVAQAAPAPAVAPVAAPAPFFARYAAAPVAPAAVAAPVAGPAFARYAGAPFVSNYAPAPVTAARYASPAVAAAYGAYSPFAAAYSTFPAAAYSAAYNGPIAYSAYPAPFASAYPGPVAAAYAAQFARAVPTAAAPTAVTTLRAAPAKLVEPVAAPGYRYP